MCLATLATGAGLAARTGVPITSATASAAAAAAAAFTAGTFL
jgi:hypothetical protein